MKDQRTPNVNTQPDDLRLARQQARQRKRRQLMIKRTIIVVVALLLVALIATTITIKIVADQKSAKHETVGFLAVKEIVVEGETRYTDEEIIKASGLYVGQSLLSVNKINAHDALVAAFPYLNTVEVGNSSFYTLRIRVSDVPVLAAVELEEDWMILGVNNRALERVGEDAIPAGTVRIKGADFETKTVGKSLLDERSLRICRTLIEAATRYDLSSMTTVDMSVKTKIHILLNQRMKVVLGNETNLTNQVKALVDILPTLYKNNGEDAAGLLNMLFYNDTDKKNDKAIYTPQELLEKLEQTQQKPMAAVQVEDGWITINGDNMALEILPEEYLPADVVRVVGATYDTAAVGQTLLDKRSLNICNAILNAAKQHSKVQVSAIDMTDKTAITLTLSEGLRVLMGDSSALALEMDALAGLLPTVWEQYGEDANGLLDMTSYGDEDDANDGIKYTPKKGS